MKFIDTILQVGEYCDKTDQQKIDKIFKYLPMEIYVHVKGMTLLTTIVDTIQVCATQSAHTQHATTTAPNPWAQAPMKPVRSDKPVVPAASTLPSDAAAQFVQIPGTNIT